GGRGARRLRDREADARAGRGGHHGRIDAGTGDGTFRTAGAAAGQ
ncbi:MAG: hypothetical protein AVDCRST_MAG19-4176, partial [uncultured Thermomicrobiales bacterium]